MTGMGVLCSVASDVPSFETALREGRSGIGPARGRCGTFAAAELRDFDYAATIDGRPVAPELRRAARIALRAPLPLQSAVVTAIEAWQQARLHEHRLPARRIGIVVAGHNFNGRLTEQMSGKSPAHVSPRFAIRFQDADHVGTLSEILGIHGESCTVGASSASGNVAIANALRMIDCGALDACLVAAPVANLSDLELQSFRNLGAMADEAAARDPATACRPFDRGRRGFVPGEGSAALVLERVESARQRGAKVLAEGRGAAVVLDGHGLADPNEEGETAAMSEAMERAGIAPGDIAYVNAHGTGTPLGDDIEARALLRVFGARPRVNSTKGLIGHCLWSAGVIEAVAVIVQMRGGFVHPNVNLAEPIDSQIRFAGARAEQVPIDVAISNGFGFGGFNSSVVLARESA